MISRLTTSVTRTGCGYPCLSFHALRRCLSTDSLMMVATWSYWSVVIACCRREEETLSLAWVKDLLSRAPCRPYGPAPEEFLDEVITDTTIFSCPEEFVSFLPDCSPRGSLDWSAFARVSKEGGTWSETGLRRRIHRELSAAQQGRLGKRRRSEETASSRIAGSGSDAERLSAKPFSDDPAGLTSLFVSAVRRSLYGAAYSKELSGPQVESPFVLEGWWTNHQIHCRPCRSFGDWAFVLEHNQHNACYMADILACLHHGFLLPFATEPAPRVLGNYDSLDLAPEASANEWSKMVANGVVKPAAEAGAWLSARGFGDSRVEFPVCGAPLLSVVKEADTEAALADLERLGHRVDLQEETPGFVDRLNGALKDCGLVRQVKARLCTDFGRTINDCLVQLPMAFHPVDELLEDLKPQFWFCKVDFRRCFHNIPLHPLMYKYMGMSWEDAIWVAVRVLFGISLGPLIACILTGETAAAVRARARAVKVYLDDMAVSARSEQLCYAGRAEALAIARRAGWPIADDKLEEDKPAQRLAYRGVVFDTVQCTLSVHVTRLRSTREKVGQLLDTEVTHYFQVRKVRSVLGSLEWISTCVPLGRLRTKRVYRDLPFGARNNWQMQLSSLGRSDLAWWRDLLTKAISGNGLERWAGFGHPLPQCPVVRILSDASGDIGFGALCMGEVVAGLWKDPESMRSGHSSAWKEWVPIRLMLERIIPKLEPGTIIVFTTDNEANAFAVNSGVAGEGSFEILESILLRVADARMRAVGDWVDRELITLIDLLSRLRPMPGSHAALC